MSRKDRDQIAGTEIEGQSEFYTAGPRYKRGGYRWFDIVGASQRSFAFREPALGGRYERFN
jgi:hypothetical protein